jgi:hypothetical protein
MVSTVLLMSLRSSTSKRRSGTVLLMSLRSSTSKRRSGTLQPLFKHYILLSTIFIQVRKYNNSNTYEEFRPLYQNFLQLTETRYHYLQMNYKTDIINQRAKQLSLNIIPTTIFKKWFCWWRSYKNISWRTN